MRVPNLAAWHVSIVIPARNEELLLRRCLHSVKAAIEALAKTATCDLIVVVDSSTDETKVIALEEVGASGAIVVTDAGIVGEARAIGTELALKRYSGPRNRHWLANTDADCIVPADWLTEQLSIAKTQVGALAGTVRVDSFEEHLPIVKQRFHDTYAVAADGTHSHVHGANIGFRADFYRQSGGWRHLMTGEDHDIWKRLAKVGARQLSLSRIEVSTSGRRVGRAPHGFAEALAAHNETLA